MPHRSQLSTKLARGVKEVVAGTCAWDVRGQWSGRRSYAPTVHLRPRAHTHRPFHMRRHSSALLSAALGVALDDDAIAVLKDVLHNELQVQGDLPGVRARLSAGHRPRSAAEAVLWCTVISVGHCESRSFTDGIWERSAGAGRGIKSRARGANIASTATACTCTCTCTLVLVQTVLQLRSGCECLTNSHLPASQGERVRRQNMVTSQPTPIVSDNQ